MGKKVQSLARLAEKQKDRGKGKLSNSLVFEHAVGYTFHLWEAPLSNRKYFQKTQSVEP